MCNYGCGGERRLKGLLRKESSARSGKGIENRERAMNWRTNVKRGEKKETRWFIEGPQGLCLKKGKRVSPPANRIQKIPDGTFRPLEQKGATTNQFSNSRVKERREGTARGTEKKGSQPCPGAVEEERGDCFVYSKMGPYGGPSANFIKIQWSGVVFFIGKDYKGSHSD